MERELAKQKLREALDGMAADEKYDLLTEELIEADKVLVPLGYWVKLQ